jgi:hypothetical protein
MKFETHWHEIRPLLLAFLLIALVMVIGTPLFARMTGRPWYDALPIFAFLTFRAARGGFRSKTRQTDETEPKPPHEFPTFAKMGRGLRRIFPVIRNTLSWLPGCGDYGRFNVASNHASAMVLATPPF